MAHPRKYRSGGLTGDSANWRGRGVEGRGGPMTRSQIPVWSDSSPRTVQAAAIC
ncbi:MAG: hypothetical protein HFH84_15790 [Lachnospiraceae bacterium]|nr:hypothetical protein [Lachnospiraceae bacterium]